MCFHYRSCTTRLLLFSSPTHRQSIQSRVKQQHNERSGGERSIKAISRVGNCLRELFLKVNMHLEKDSKEKLMSMTRGHDVN